MPLVVVRRSAIAPLKWAKDPLILLVGPRETASAVPLSGGQSDRRPIPLGGPLAMPVWTASSLTRCASKKTGFQNSRKSSHRHLLIRESDFSGRCVVDLDPYIITVFCWIDDRLKTGFTGQRLRQRRATPPCALPHAAPEKAGPASLLPFLPP